MPFFPQVLLLCSYNLNSRLQGPHRQHHRRRLYLSFLLLSPPYLTILATFIDVMMSALLVAVFSVDSAFLWRPFYIGISSHFTPLFLCLNKVQLLSVPSFCINKILVAITQFFPTRQGWHYYIFSPLKHLAFIVYLFGATSSTKIININRISVH